MKRNAMRSIPLAAAVAGLALLAVTPGARAERGRPEGPTTLSQEAEQVESTLASRLSLTTSPSSCASGLFCRPIRLPDPARPTATPTLAHPWLRIGAILGTLSHLPALPDGMRKGRPLDALRRPAEPE